MNIHNFEIGLGCGTIIRHILPAHGNVRGLGKSETHVDEREMSQKYDSIAFKHIERKHITGMADFSSQSSSVKFFHRQIRIHCVLF